MICRTGTTSMVLAVLSAQAQLLTPPQRHDQFTAVIQPTVSKNTVSGVHTYTYDVANNSGPNGQAIESVWIRWRGQRAPALSAIQAPPGWTVVARGDSGDVISWVATQFASQTSPDGQIPQPSSAIQPGQRLGGFSFQTKAAPVSGQVFLRGFAPLPSVQDAGTEIPPKYMPPFDADSVALTAAVPDTDTISQSDTTADKNNLLIVKNRDALRANTSTSVTVLLRFGVGGERADLSTLRVTLNDTDVRSRFVPMSAAEMTATFTVTDGVLRRGPNTFRASVEGVVPGLAASQLDTEWVTISVPRLLGDINGDGTVNCSDLNIVRASFGTRLGHPGFNSDADLNLDRIIDVRDLAALSKGLPAAVTCP